jgi:hypothetical protein
MTIDPFSTVGFPHKVILESKTKVVPVLMKSLSRTSSTRLLKVDGLRFYKSNFDVADYGSF